MTSCLLTIKLTASTSFITNKDSGVLSPSFGATDESKADDKPVPEPKRKVMYYVRLTPPVFLQTLNASFCV